MNKEFYKIEEIIFENKKVGHSLFEIQNNIEKGSLRIVVKSDKEETTKEFLFEKIKSFSYDIEDESEYDQWPRLIFGIDYYPLGKEDEFNTVINCGDLEFAFFSFSDPIKIE